VSASSAVAGAEAAFIAARAIRRRASLAQGALLLALLVLAGWVAEFHPATLWAGLPRIGEYFSRITPDLRWAALLGGAGTEGSLAFWFYRLDAWALLLFETAQMAALATLMGAAAGLLLAFPAARNLGAPRWLSVGARRLLEATRTVPEIVFALIFVWAFGVGALAGILAIALHSTGALGKLFSELAENADMKPVEGAIAAGGVSSGKVSVNATRRSVCRWKLRMRALSSSALAMMICSPESERRRVDLRPMCSTVP